MLLVVLLLVHLMWQSYTRMSPVHIRISGLRVGGVVMRTTPLVRVTIVDLPQRASLSVKVLSVLDVVNFGNELFLYRFAGVKTVEGLANHQLEIVIGLFNLTYVDALELNKEKKMLFRVKICHLHLPSM